MFRAIYGLSIQYEATNNIWTILCEGDISAVKTDLDAYGIACDGEIRGNVDINGVVAALTDDNLKRRFIAGLADTIGSMAKSQRRFTDEHQIISFEIKGYNFQFVCNLCNLLYSINCIPDQVNWNHPNIHCTNDPYYSRWSKGFKLRVLLDQYAKFGAFAFRTKAESSAENLQLQSKTHIAKTCDSRDFHVTPSCVHPGETAQQLPENISRGHYIHFRHFCTVMGCEHAPYDKIDECFKSLGDKINPFPILSRYTHKEIEELIRKDPLMNARTYTVQKMEIAPIFKQYEKDPDALVYGITANDGYPISVILKGVAYIIADKSELSSGKRTKKYTKVIRDHLDADPNLNVEIHQPELLTPLVIYGNGRGVLIGARNPHVYEKLITHAPENAYKLIVRQITEEDLSNVLET